MNILVTGNKGYIGAVLTELLLAKGYKVIGYDTAYYESCEFYKPPYSISQIKKDIRDASVEDFQNVDAVIHLAALSNDPLGELDSRITEEINFQATLKIADCAKRAGVKKFIYASSQSIYGISKTDQELDEDNSEKDPLTAYARTKWEAERELKKMCDGNFTVVCFRLSTVFGASSNFRCDIVFNNFISCAYTTGKIKIKSDGTPWRPVVHVQDVSNAFIAGIEAPWELVSGRSFNVGIKGGNYTVKELALAAQKAVPGSELAFTGEHNRDVRTYKVSFKRILNVLKDYYKPKWDLDSGAKELIDFFKKVDFTQAHFSGRNCNRLKQINYLLETKQVDEKLKWRKK